MESEIDSQQYDALGSFVALSATLASAALVAWLVARLLGAASGRRPSLRSGGDSATAGGGAAERVDVASSDAHSQRDSCPVERRCNGRSWPEFRDGGGAGADGGGDHRLTNGGHSSLNWNSRPGGNIAPPVFEEHASAVRRNSNDVEADLSRSKVDRDRFTVYNRLKPNADQKHQVEPYVDSFGGRLTEGAPVQNGLCENSGPNSCLAERADVIINDAALPQTSKKNSRSRVNGETENRWKNAGSLREYNASLREPLETRSLNGNSDKPTPPADNLCAETDDVELHHRGAAGVLVEVNHRNHFLKQKKRVEDPFFFSGDRNRWPPPGDNSALAKTTADDDTRVLQGLDDKPCYTNGSGAGFQGVRCFIANSYSGGPCKLPDSHRVAFPRNGTGDGQPARNLTHSYEDDSNHDSYNGGGERFDDASGSAVQDGDHDDDDVNNVGVSRINSREAFVVQSRARSAPATQPQDGHAYPPAAGHRHHQQALVKEDGDPAVIGSKISAATAAADSAASFNNNSSGDAGLSEEMCRHYLLTPAGTYISKP